MCSYSSSSSCNKNDNTSVIGVIAGLIAFVLVICLLVMYRRRRQGLIIATTATPARRDLEAGTRPAPAAGGESGVWVEREDGVVVQVPAAVYSGAERGAWVEREEGVVEQAPLPAYSARRVRESERSPGRDAGPEVPEMEAPPAYQRTWDQER